MASVSRMSVLRSSTRLLRGFDKSPSNFSWNTCLICRGFSKTTVIGNKPVRIGCASGFWGDSAVAAPQLIHRGKLDFLVFDYLSEITMSLLTAAQHKLPEMGYAPDFVQVAIGPFVKDIKKKGIRVVSNAGGINPVSCAAALQEVCQKAGVDLNIAVVTGDNLLPMKDKIESMGVREVDSGLSLPPSVTSMTAYLGAGSIAQALDQGADIVVTGRCTDSALVLGPLMHTYKWPADDFDRLAAGSLAGHLIECGAQATGGVFTDWHLVPDWHNIGFPIVECESDGSFVLTKPQGTGGLVTRATVSEQLLYEIGDPQNYVLPDVVCDFSNVQMTELKDGAGVHVSGAKGKPPTDSYKVSATYAEGNRITVVCSIGGPRAADKARKTVDAIIKRTQAIFKAMKLDDFTNLHIQILGAEDTYGNHAIPPEQAPREAVVWLAAHHKDKKALGVLAREIAPAGTGMAPGLTGIVGGRPKVSPVLKLFSYLYPKDELAIEIHMSGETVEHTPTKVPTQALISRENDPAPAEDLPKGEFSYRLEDLAYTRSGDKGNNCNIGVIARDPSYLPYIKAVLTPEAVDSYMAHVFDDRSGTVDSRVKRYDVPGIDGMNFVLHNSLGGGGIASLRSDPQGKAFGQMLLDFKLENLPKIK